jgi:cardiolipin synthase
MPIPAQLPNAISAFRVLLLPVWVACAEAANRAAERGEPSAPLAMGALATLVVIGLSDTVDGHLARRFGLSSRTGAVLDAVADKLAQVVLFTYLALRVGPAFAPVPVWFLALLIARDALLLCGLVLLRARAGRVEVVHRAHGKAASLVLFVLLIMLTAGLRGSVMTTLLTCTAVLITVSTALYARDGWRQRRGTEPAAA